MKLIKTSIVLVLLIVFSSACKKNLIVADTSAVSSDFTWSSSATADVFLNDIYNSLPDLYSGVFDPMENWSDNSMCGFNWSVSATLFKDMPTITASSDLGVSWNGPGGASFYWATLYANIRKCNVFITNVQNSASLPASYKNSRLGEVYVLRAFFYHYLWMMFGGVPDITMPDNTTTNANVAHARNSFDETFNFIESDLNAAIKVLPANNGNSGGGRATLGSAYTLKSWVELFYASKLNNPSNDKSRWENAAASAKAVMGMGYALYPKYNELFYQTGNANNEGIFYREYLGTVKGSNLISYQGPQTIGNLYLSWGGVNPTQGLVDDYAMANGKAITDAGSGYNANNPYTNREPRFYQSILYNGSTFDGYAYNTYTGQFNGATANQAIDLADASDVTNTGYAMRKKLDTTVNIFQAGASGQTLYYFRYAEVLLNYAEAQNEAVGPDVSVYAALDQIRSRAGIPTISSIYPGISQDQMRIVIRRERRIELAFEDKRYWDLIRWKIAEVNLNNPMQAMLIKGSGNTFTYSVITAARGSRTFDPAKNYLLPIPQNALSQNKLLTQNPGY